MTATTHALFENLEPRLLASAAPLPHVKTTGASPPTAILASLFAKRFQSITHQPQVTTPQPVAVPPTLPAPVPAPAAIDLYPAEPSDAGPLVA